MVAFKVEAIYAFMGNQAETFAISNAREKKADVYENKCCPLCKMKAGGKKS